MLKKVHFKSIKSLLDVQVELGRLTFLVGSNGCSMAGSGPLRVALAGGSPPSTGCPGGR